LTADLALRFDPIYAEICKRFLENPEYFEKVFARAWFKLTHRDMGPKELYLGPEVPEEEFPWQDPLPRVDHELVDDKDVEELKREVLSSGISIPQLVYTCFSGMVTYRHSDRKGGLNGARLRLEPQKNWEVNHPEDLSRVLNILEGIRDSFNKRKAKEGKKVSLSDLIAISGCAAIEEAVRKAGYQIKIPFVPGRSDATQEQNDLLFWSQVEPVACGFRNYLKDKAIN
ncbi:MAG: catalase-peroxidase, partial [Cyclobacteriaceae bacterium]|nr:catalase-peroxidase [Cyclobacteriaceae bacterium]